MSYSIEKLSSANYSKSNSVWNMKSCPFTEQFKKEIDNGNRDSFLRNAMVNT